MSVHVKAQCRAGCGDLGDPELDYLCVDCHGDQVELRQQEELRKYMAKESRLAASEEQDVVTTPPSPVRKYRGPRPVDHAKALDDFLHRHREQDPNVVARELTFLKREILIRETSKKQLRKYMVATDEEEQVDPKEWSRYEFGPPKAVPARDVEEAVELAAQLKVYCRWRRIQVQKRIEIRRQQLEAERLALKKQKKKQIYVPLLSLGGALRGSTKTAVEHPSPVARHASPSEKKREVKA
ncbi:hypothetical protein PF005_g9505 [Phytophthora fragariae]|uniref:A20-type domain-containing protein n=1 Tax=Phytophthora fragariae TaxID=53985 RepID=A0A6A3L6E6_9STRA|nr:hypothetical protein PF003_g32672 [Phytophthora fragariae]KAE8939838.1 hypothetical protein PF009_g10331 [Phytophthora fragariae]KAE9013507.1 hypothetical protein PF011_g8450 [Phytophthora fragariae]KAE9116619.1 hypothetical protein PF007_g9588 [Phytophthora fragariae]KAE9119163.1 hypothetical protein PF010_g7963 [Phytophthora fragariae]